MTARALAVLVACLGVIIVLSNSIAPSLLQGEAREDSSGHPVVKESYPPEDNPPPTKSFKSAEQALQYVIEEEGPLIGASGAEQTFVETWTVKELAETAYGMFPHLWNEFPPNDAVYVVWMWRDEPFRGEILGPVPQGPLADKFRGLLDAEGTFRPGNTMIMILHSGGYFESQLFAKDLTPDGDSEPDNDSETPSID